MATNSMAWDTGAAGPSKGPPPSSSSSPSMPTTPAAVVKREGSSKSSGAPSTSSGQQEGPRTRDAKTLRRLAQNREAARKSRLRKKAYIQNLETSRIRLSHLEQELQRSNAQGAVFGGGLALSGGGIVGGLSPEAAWFDAEHARWVDEHGKIMCHLRAAMEEQRQQQQHADDDDDAQLRQLVDAAAAHHGVLAEMKAAVARADAFHLVSGTWVSAAERCFLWIAGFRPSDLIKVATRHAEPLTEPQAMGICGLQQWASEAEAALDHELHAMHRSVSEAVTSDAAAARQCPYPDVPGYMATMSIAITKLASLEAFVRQADALRLQTLHRLPQILTVRQSARCFLAIADYSHRLRALSELWYTRPRQETVTAPPVGSSHIRPSY